MTGKDRNFRNHKANTRNTRIRKSKLSQKAGAIFSPLLSNIKQWDTSYHFKSSEEHFIFETHNKVNKRVGISNLFKSDIFKNEKSAAKSVVTSLNLDNSMSYLSYLFDGTLAEEFQGVNPSSLTNNFYQNSSTSSKKNAYFKNFQNSYIIKPDTNDSTASNPWTLSNNDTKNLCLDIYNAVDANKLSSAYKILDRSSNGNRSLLFSVLGLIHFQYFKMQLFSVENEFLSNIFLEKKFGQNTIVDSGGELSKWIPFIIHFQKYFEDVWNRNSLGFNPPGIKATMTTGSTICNHMIENNDESSSFFGGSRKSNKKGGAVEWGNFIGHARNAAMVVEKNMQEQFSININPKSKIGNSIKSYKFNDPYSLSPYMMMLLHKTYLCLRLSRKYLLTSMYLGEVRSLITLNEDLAISRMDKSSKKLSNKLFINKQEFIRNGDLSQLSKGNVLSQYAEIIDRCVSHLSVSPLSINDPNFRSYLLTGKKDKLTSEKILRQIRLRSQVKPLTYIETKRNLDSFESNISFSDLAPQSSRNEDFGYVTNPFGSYNFRNLNFGGNKEEKKEEKNKK